MAKEKRFGDRDLGTVTKKLPSGMFETNSGEKIPPLPEVMIGSVVSLEGHSFVVKGGKKEKQTAPADTQNAEMDAMRAENERLKAIINAKPPAKPTLLGDTGKQEERQVAPKVGE